MACTMVYILAGKNKTYRREEKVSDQPLCDRLNPAMPLLWAQDAQIDMQIVNGCTFRPHPFRVNSYIVFVYLDVLLAASIFR